MEYVHESEKERKERETHTHTTHTRYIYKRRCIYVCMRVCEHAVRVRVLHFRLPELEPNNASRMPSTTSETFPTLVLISSFKADMSILIWFTTGVTVEEIAWFVNCSLSDLAFWAFCDTVTRAAAMSVSTSPNLSSISANLTSERSRSASRSFATLFSTKTFKSSSLTSVSAMSARIPLIDVSPFASLFFIKKKEKEKEKKISAKVLEAGAIEEEGTWVC